MRVYVRNVGATATEASMNNEAVGVIMQVSAYGTSTLACTYIYVYMNIHTYTGKAASEAGVKVMDVVESVNGVKMKEKNDFKKMIDAQLPG